VHQPRDDHLESRLRAGLRRNPPPNEQPKLASSKRRQHRCALRLSRLCTISSICGRPRGDVPLESEHRTQTQTLGCHVEPCLSWKGSRSQSTLFRSVYSSLDVLRLCFVVSHQSSISWSFVVGRGCPGRGSVSSTEQAPLRSNAGPPSAVSSLTGDVLRALSTHTVASSSSPRFTPQLLARLQTKELYHRFTFPGSPEMPVTLVPSSTLAIERALCI
jgi:hypothetical protein